MKRILVLATAGLLLLAACGGSDDTVNTPGSAAEDQGESAPEEGTEKESADVSGEDEVDVEVDDFYFEPAILQGEAGQKLTVVLENEGDATHNFTLEDQGIDEDIEPGDDVEVEVTFPDSGSLEFHCKFHAGQGMTGSLEVAG